MPKFVSDLLSDRRGNVLTLTAVGMPLLIGALALGIDTFQIAVHNRELQRAADSAALAGAFAAAEGQEVRPAAQDSLDKNPHATLTKSAKVTVEPWGEFHQTVHVEIVARPNLPFIEFFTGSPADFSVSARAALAGTQERFCMLSLYDGNDAGIRFSGTNQTTLDCGVMANSTSKEAISFDGGATLEAVVAAAVGDLDGTGGNFLAPTKLSPYSIAQADPLAGLKNPDEVGDSDACKSIKVKALIKKILGPGCYKELDLNGDVTLLPGTYYINEGDVKFGSKSKVLGMGVTIVLTGEDGDAGTIKWDGGASVNLSSSAFGDYPGVLFYRDRRAKKDEIQISGNSNLQLTGAIYAPNSDIKMTGGANLNVECLQLIARQIRLAGNVNVTSDCPEDSGAAPFRFTRARIVN
jgi:Flp pilus assembly protein TadG